jgi:hypothetical protein
MWQGEGVSAFAVVAGAPDIVYAPAGLRWDWDRDCDWRRGGRGGGWLLLLLLLLLLPLLLFAPGRWLAGRVVQRKEARGGVQRGHGAGDVVCCIMPSAEVGRTAVRHCLAS